MIRIRLLGWVGSLVLLAAVAPGVAAKADSAELDVAVLQAPEGTRLADILSGRARVGFTPLLGLGAPLSLQPDSATWVRLRGELPAHAAGEWLLRLERTPLTQVRVLLPQAPEQTQAELDFFTGDGNARRSGAALHWPLPAADAGPLEIYLELRGNIRVGLLPVLLNDQAAQAADAEAAAWLNGSLVGLALVILAALVRFGQRPSSGAGSVALASAALILGCLAQSGVLYGLPGGEGLVALGPMGLWMFLLLPCGPVLLATATYSGLPYSLPRLVPIVRSTALALPGLALLVLALRSELVGVVQVVVWAAWLGLGGASVLLLLLDSRTYRWGPILLWLVLLVALWLRAAAELQLLWASPRILFGFYPVLALLMASMLVLPWIRSALQQRQMRNRAVVVEKTAAEKIAEARNLLLEALRSGLDNAAERDVEWIAFRRLLTGMKPVLPQLSSAVMAMNYREEDLLQVEPMDAEARYRTLLGQRSSLLRGLSRSRGAQQIAIDFDGDEGPLPPVQLAVIPLPIEKPGWGVMLVERPAGVTYSDEELELCSEFAALATTASDEAAMSVRARREAEIDPGTGAYRTELIQQLLAQKIETAYTGNQQVTVMRIEVDGIEDWCKRDEPVANEALRQIGNVLRDELEFDEALGRLDASTYLMVMHGRNANVCRPVADRIMAAVAEMPLPPEIKVCIGISELRRGESAGGPMIERAGHAVIAARRAGSPCTA